MQEFVDGEQMQMVMDDVKLPVGLKEHCAIGVNQK